MIGKLSLAAAFAGALMLLQPGGASAASLSQAGLNAKPTTANIVTPVHRRSWRHRHRHRSGHFRRHRPYYYGYNPYYYSYYDYPSYYYYRPYRHRYYRRHHRPQFGIYLSF